MWAGTFSNDMMLLKLEEENQKLDSHTLLCWANMARNSLQMWNGYSSHQLVFGRNPKLPGIMTDALPALEGMTSSELFAQHLNMLHKPAVLTYKLRPMNG